MNAQIILDPTHPHGTPEGYVTGCKGSHCPAPVKCRDVHVRYSGDYSYRKAIDAGTTAIELLAREQEAAQADLAAKRARPGTRAGASRNDRRAAANQARGEQSRLIRRDVLQQLLDEGLTDRAIAHRLGLTRRQVTQTRTNAGLPHNPDRRGGERTSIDTRLHTVAHLNPVEAAKVLGRSAAYVRRRRQIIARKTREEAAA